MKKYTIIWSDQSLSSLNHIYHFISSSSPQNASKVVDALLNLGDSLATFPNGYKSEPLLSNEATTYRSVSKWNYLLIYTVEEETQTVVVVKIFDTRQNPIRMSVES